MRGQLVQLLARAGGGQAALLGNGANAATSRAASWGHAWRQLATAAGGSGEQEASQAAASADEAQPAASEGTAAPTNQQPGEAAAAKSPEAAPAAKTPPAKREKKPAAPKAAGSAAGAAKQPRQLTKQQSKQSQSQQSQAKQQQAGKEPRQAASTATKSPTLAQLLEVPEGAYFDVPPKVVPEATKEYYQDPVLKGENVHEPNFGCKAVHAEWEYSGRRSLMARACMHALARTVQGLERPQLFLDGWAGSGKSVALYSLVAWAREHGFLALYIPSAFSLVQNGTFYRGEDGLWDTPEAARWILSGLRDNHAPQLAELALKTPAGRPVTEVLEEGLAPGTKPDAVVAAAIAAKEALAATTEVPTLLAVDDYNVLYSHTGYYEPVHTFHRRQLSPDELRLVQAFRILDQPPPARGVAIAAPTFGQTITPRLRLPLPRGCRFGVPRYSVQEFAAAAEYFGREVLPDGQPVHDETDLLRAFFLTNGNAKELRDLAPSLFLGTDLLGLSRGYKAEAARKRRYEQEGLD